MLKCYTIGHSNHILQDFVNLLYTYEIDKLIDVRSNPYSGFVRQFDKENLEYELKRNNIQYKFEGEVLGAKRKSDDYLFPDGFVNFNKIREDAKYKVAIQRIVNDVKYGKKVAIMCSEKNPYDCHRFVLIAYSLEKIGLVVDHILADGSLETNQNLEKRLICDYNPNLNTKFDIDNDELINPLDYAYMERNRKIAYKGRG